MSTLRHRLSHFKPPKPASVVGLGLSVGALYFVWSANERKKRAQAKFHEVKDDFNRIKEEKMDKLKQAKEEFKCMPVVQEAQEKATEFKSKWQEGKERFKQNRAEFKEALKRSKAYQELAMSMPDLAKRIEGEMDVAMETMAILENANDRGRILVKYPDEEELTLTIQCCRDSMDRLKELMQQDSKRLGWTLTVAAELNNLHTQTKKLKTWIGVTDEFEAQESGGLISSDTMSNSD